MNGLQTFAISTGSMIVLYYITAWYQNKKKKAEMVSIYEKIISSPDDSWQKVGEVKEIYYYPLKSGRGVSLEKCNLEKKGISVDAPGVIAMKDRMFMVYEEKSGRYRTGRRYPKLLLVNISAVSKNHVKLESQDMPPLELDLSIIKNKRLKTVKCYMWWDEPVKCIDCGPEASEWLSKYLVGSGTSVRLGLYVHNYHRQITKGGWKKFAQMYNTWTDEDSGLYSDLASYMVLSQSSVNDLNEKLKNPIQALQLRPNIIVDGCEPFSEDEWEWLKIGKTAIIHKIKLCTRCNMVKVDPDTGLPDSESEPLKTLGTYRKLKDPELDVLENHSPAIGVYFGLYKTGPLQLGDEVEVYRP